jgi:hypothetical protein
MLKTERLESQIILKCWGAIKPKDINRRAKISYGQVYLREWNLSFDHNYII